MVAGYYLFKVTTIPLGETGVDLKVSNKEGIYLECTNYNYNIRDSYIIKIGFNERYVIAVTDTPNVFGEEMVDYFYFDKEDPYDKNLELPSLTDTLTDEEEFYHFAEEKGIEVVDIEEFLKENK